MSREVESHSTTPPLPVAPSLVPALLRQGRAQRAMLVDARVAFISVLAVALAVAAGLVAELLTRLIGLITNLAFYGRWSSSFASPAQHGLGAWVVIVPIAGGLLVGLMARFGAKAIRGHGIPEAMEQVLTNDSRIPARMTWLKPLSAAIAIGTGGPFGAEGPIIATGGALGSLLGQLVPTSAHERKTLLAGGAAAGMAATFGSPVSAVLLAVELLLFEYRPRSLIPVALAAVTATGVRGALVGDKPAFVMPELAPASGPALAAYVAMGVLLGVVAVGITRAVYAVEDAFERLPLHWMWWPALGGLVVGLVGYVEPHTLGVGYDNIEHILSGAMLPRAVIALCGLKFVAWVIALGSGTSGGTLAPLFTLGGGLGAVLGAALAALAPALGVDVRVAALVGMAAMFAGASRALLASVVFAFETTRQPLGLLPLLGGSSAAFLVSCWLMRHSIMTEKIARRGIHAVGEYTADVLAQITAERYTRRPVVTIRAEDTLASVQAWFASGAPESRHRGYPVVDERGCLVGVLSRRELLHERDATQSIRALISRACVAVHEDSSLRDAAELMATERVGRLPIIARTAPQRVIGILTRRDFIEASGATQGALQRFAALAERPSFAPAASSHERPA